MSLNKTLKAGDTIYIRSWYSNGDKGTKEITAVGRDYFTISGGRKFCKVTGKGHRTINPTYTAWNSEEEWAANLHFGKEKDRLWKDLQTRKIEVQSLERIKEIREFLGLGE